MPEMTYDWVASPPQKKPAEMPPKVYEMGGLRIVDLTKVLDPNTESRRCRLWRYNTGGSIPDFHTIMDLTSHLGTHCECPYHHDETWPSVAELPLTNFCGRAIYEVLDLPENHQITGADLEKAIGDRVKEGDIVLLDSPHKIPPFTPATNGPDDHRLVVSGDCAEWLAKKKVKCVGFGDGVSIEDCVENVKPFHDVLMAQNVTFLEVLQNLDLLKTDTFFMSFAPLPIIGLDSCPVRAYAIEGLTEFSK